MRLELDHFYIGDSCGGQQEWFTEFMMNKGGCGCVTACDSCISMSRFPGLEKLYPFLDRPLTRQAYLDFSQIMKPYLKPRKTGIDRLDIYIDGFTAYLRDHGVDGLTLDGFEGTNPVHEAVNAVERQLEKGFPIPYLLLLHRDPVFDDYQWHWFLLTGLDRPDPDSAAGAQVKAVTYGKGVWMDFTRLWNTGHRRKGGMILFDRPPKQEGTKR
ncbi:MAG: hypothetical protein IKD85_04215 [Firmicutes bacterium]|nr:hypothetical protein [Bacillota bacterium]